LPNRFAADVAAAWNEGEDRRLQRPAPIIRSLPTRRSVIRPELATAAAAVPLPLTGPDLCRLLVMERGLPPAKFEQRLGEHLIRALLP